MDAELRELERRYRRSQTDADAAAWLRGRLRTGDLSEGTLETAALLGHPLAGRLVPDAPPLRQRDLKAWGEGVERLGRQREVAHALSELAAPFAPRPMDPDPSEVVAALDPSREDLDLAQLEDLGVALYRHTLDALVRGVAPTTQALLLLHVVLRFRERHARGREDARSILNDAASLLEHLPAADPRALAHRRLGLDLPRRDSLP